MAQQYGPKVVTDGLVLSLDAADKNSYPGSGTTWTDLSGNGNNGTLTNGPTFDSGNGGSIVFDGGDDYVDCGSASVLDNFFDGGGTFCAWIKPESGGEGNQARIFDKRDASNGVVLHFDDESGSTCKLKLYRNYSSTSGAYRTTNRDITYGDWCYVVVTYDISGAGSSYRPTFYINGLSVAATYDADSAGSYDTDASEPLILGNTETTDRAFDGKIAISRVYDRALSAKEVSQNFNAQRSRFGV